MSSYGRGCGEIQGERESKEDSCCPTAPWGGGGRVGGGGGGVVQGSCCLKATGVVEG